MHPPFVSLICLFLFLQLAGAQAPAAKPDLNQQAVVSTSEGTFVLSFYPDKAPRHVQLFLSLAAEGAYDGTLFHRVIKWGIIQGGDPLSKDPARKALWGTGGMNKVASEASDVKHVRGTLSSVLLPGKPDSGGNQFFLCVTPQPQLDGFNENWQITNKKSQNLCSPVSRRRFVTVITNDCSKRDGGGFIDSGPGRNVERGNWLAEQPENGLRSRPA